MTRTRLILLAAAAITVGLFFITQTIRWSGAGGAQRAHEKFLERIEDRRWSKCHAMVAEGYSDRWEFSRDDISLALQDLGAPFTFGLTIEWKPVGAPEEQGDGSFVITGTARLDGSGSPIADMVLSRVNGYAATPFTFRWEREGLLPWRWKLVSIDHPTLEVPRGYTPGDLGSAASRRF